MSTSTLVRCDACGITAPEPRLGNRPDGWFTVYHDGPTFHFCKIGCLALHMRPTAVYSGDGWASGGPPGEPDPPQLTHPLAGGGPDD